MRETLTSPWLIFLPKKSVLIGKKLFIFFVQGGRFGIFIVLRLHKESLRIMIEKGLVNKDVKIKVLEMLKPIVCNRDESHGDIKDSFELFFLRI